MNFWLLFPLNFPLKIDFPTTLFKNFHSDFHQKYHFFKLNKIWCFRASEIALWAQKYKNEFPPSISPSTSIFRPQFSIFLHQIFTKNIIFINQTKSDALEPLRLPYELRNSKMNFWLFQNFKISFLRNLGTLMAWKWSILIHPFYKDFSYKNSKFQKFQKIFSFSQPFFEFVMTKIFRFFKKIFCAQNALNFLIFKNIPSVRKIDFFLSRYEVSKK